MISFVCLAVIVLGYVVIRSRSPVGAASTDSAAIEGNSPARSFRVVRVVDGDTIVVIGLDQIELTVRLADIDAPENRQPFGQDATQFLRGLVEGQAVQLEDLGRGKYGRELAQVYADSQWIELSLVQHGWAWVYPESDSRVLRDAEASARANKLGLWSAQTPIPPWDWRKGER